MYLIKPHTQERARAVGLEVRPSSKRGKKIDVYKDGLYIDSVGATGYKDYPTYLATEGKEVADERRRLYHIRHRKNSLGELLALWLLW